MLQFHLKNSNLFVLTFRKNIREILTSIHLFKNEVESVTVFKIFQQLKNVWSSGALVKQLHFFENFHTTVALNMLFDNLK